MSNQDFNPESGPSASGSVEGGIGGDIADGVGGSGDFTETTSRSWFQKIINGFKAILIGLLLVIASVVLMSWNEGRSAKTAAALSEGAGAVVSIGADKIDPANEGKLVHVAGDTRADRAIRDADFGFDARGLRLVRKVEMYQWKEERHSETQKKLGGGEETVTRYTYAREWSESAVDSSRFRSSADHRNPSMPPVSSRSFQSTDAKVGAFTLGEPVLKLLSATEKFDAPEGALTQARAKLGPRAQVRQGGVYAGSNPDQPNVGDVRVTWSVLPLTPVSVVARQTQSTFSPWLARNGNEVLLAETGVKEAALLFKHGQDENRLLTWILRVAGVLVMFVGFRVMMSLLEALADIIPFLGNVVGAGSSLVALLCTLIIAPIVIAIAWLFYRPLVAVGALLVGAVLVYGLRTLMRNRVAARGPLSGPQPAGTPASFLGGVATIARKLPGAPPDR